ncbi:MAG: hypothetical protein NT069_28155, partial [Planctomycetota bacterium]|nr:hypothetical protein [Planctomycetota bacterium]
EPDGWPREILFRHNHNAPVYRLSFGSKRPVQSLLVGPIVHLDVEDVGRPQIFGSVSDPIPLRGRTLWKRQGKWLPFGDVNRDGVFGVVGAGGYHSGNAVSGCFGVFSGVDGSCIWMANQPMLYSYSKLRVDVDSDGAPELFGVVRELGVDGSSEARQSVQKTELRAYSGATGKLRWSCLPFRSLDLLWAKDPTKVEIPNLYNASGASGPERTLPVWQLGDLDGDGVAELGASCRLSENGDSDDRTDWICLISGRTGAVLWSRLYTAKERRQSFKRPGFIRFPEGASSGSTNGVLIAEIDYASFGDTRGQLLYLDWKKDREIWSTPLVVEAACESTEPAVDFRERAIQIANLGSTGGPIVLVPVGNGERTEIQLRDFATGAIEQRVSVPHGFPYQSRMSLEFDGARRPLVIGGNDRWESVVWGFEGRPVFSTPNSTAPIPGRLPGREGFVVFAIHGREIVCHDWERNTVLWRRVIPSNIPFDSLIACPSEASTSAILVMARHRDSSLTYFTLDAATGVPRWEFCDVGVQIPNPWEFGAMQSPRYLRANERHPESRCDVTYCHEIPLLGPPEKSSPVHVTP